MHKAWLHQVLCCVTLALVIVSVAEDTSNAFLIDTLAHPVYTYLCPLLRGICREPAFDHEYLGWVMAFLLAAEMGALVWALSYFRPLRSILLSSAGIVSVAAYPLGCLWVWYWRWTSRAQGVPWLLLEILIVIVSAMLYLYGRWPLSGRLTLVLLAAHFSFWQWVEGNVGRALDIARGYGFSHWAAWFTMLAVFLLSILAFASTFAWAAYLRSSSKVEVANS